jgi:hypothetical protein
MVKRNQHRPEAVLPPGNRSPCRTNGDVHAFESEPVVAPVPLVMATLS